ncbi:hypothetical protein ACFE04_004348 [Oxalis oulophora]
MEYPHHIFTHHNHYHVLIWNAMIRGYAFNGPFDNTLQMFDEMPHRGLKPNNYTYPSVLNACIEMGVYDKGKSVHCMIVKSGFDSNLFVASSLFNLYVKMVETCGGGRISDARKVFDGMVIKPVEMWNRMIGQYVNVNDLKRARELFDKVPEKDVVSWNSIIAGYAKVGDVESARDLFVSMPEKNVVSWTSMVKAYSYAGKFDAARKFFSQMPCKNEVSWSCMISSCTQHGKYEEALKLFVQMQSEKVTADGFTFVSCLTACSNLGALEFGKWIHYLVKDGWSQQGVMVGTALVQMYARCGDIDRAFTVFVKIGKKDVFCWNVMIKSLAIHGRTEEAIKMFYLMQKMGLKPNEHTLSSALFACSHGGLVDEGNKIFLNMEKNYEISPKHEHFCCVIDLLSRNGRIEEALQLLEKMPYEADTAIWGALLGGCRVTSDVNSAEKVMESARKMGVNEPGVFALLSNIHALAGQWMEAQNARDNLEDNKIWKTAGIHWDLFGAFPALYVIVRENEDVQEMSET